MEIGKLNAVNNFDKTMFKGVEKQTAPDNKQGVDNSSVFEQNKPVQGKSAETPDLTGLNGTNGDQNTGQKLNMFI